jgi:hypothetical protein
MASFTATQGRYLSFSKRTIATTNISTNFNSADVHSILTAPTTEFPTRSQATRGVKTHAR